MRTMGPSRSSNASSLMMAASSPARPPVLVSSWRRMTLLVFFTVCVMASRSSGQSERRSRISISIPSLARISAASCAVWTMAAYVIMLKSRPSRCTRALPIGTTWPFSDTSSLMRRYRNLCSRNRTGLLSRMADLIRPLASLGVAGATTFIPGVWTKCISGFWQRSGRTPAIMRLRHHVHDLVKGAADEVHELELSHRTHASKARAKGCANNGRLSNRCINPPLRTKVVDKTVRHFERAAINADVFTDAEDCGVGLHLFPESLPDCFEICCLGHVFEIPSAARDHYHHKRSLCINSAS